MTTVCFAEDEYTRALEDDSATALWQAHLSDGSTVTMDDGRPGLVTSSAWIRLARYLEASSLRIVSLWLKFRSNCDKSILIPNAAGYFFSKQIMGEMTDGSQVLFYLIGAIEENGELWVEQWSVPSLELVSREKRPFDSIKPEQIIRTIND